MRLVCYKAADFKVRNEVNYKYKSMAHGSLKTSNYAKSQVTAALKTCARKGLLLWQQDAKYGVSTITNNE
ncbi:hypothetical protein GCM10027293_24790 [Pontibacter aydingkolensis]